MLLDNLAEFHVIVRPHGNGLVHPALPIGLGPDQIKSADTHMGIAVWIRDFPDTKVLGEQGSKEGHESFQQPAGHSNLGRHGKVIQLALLHVANCPT